MPALDEDAIRAAIDAGVRAALAALHEPDEVTQVVDEWPDWNEYVDENGVMEEAAYVAALSGAFDGPSPLRARLTQGIVEPVNVLVEDEDQGFGDVVPMGVTSASSSGGYQPSDDWLTAQWNRQPAAYRTPSALPGWATEQWAEVG